MKPLLDVSINPTYQCNMDCPFCYLKGKHDSPVLSIEKLLDVFNRLKETYEINNVDLYGGEILTLPSDYVQSLIWNFENKGKSFSIVTNGTIHNPILMWNTVELNFSWDYKFRPKYKEVLDYVDSVPKMFNKTPTVILTSPLLNSYKYEVVDILNSTEHEFYIDVKPCYHTSKNNVAVKDSFYAFQQLVLFLHFNCKHKILPALSCFEQKQPPPLHCFIDPYGNVVDIAYDENGNEYFKPFDGKLCDDKQCENCRYKNGCFKEHGFVKTDFDCCGQKNLIETLQEIGDKKLDWSKRRKLYYAKNKQNLDDVGLPFSFINQTGKTLADTVVSFFENGSDLVYPAKSYYVAIVYAYLLSKYFGEDFKTALDYDDLLNHDDRYFVRYSDDKQTYNLILRRVFDNLVQRKYDISKTEQYFKKEFLFGE